MISPNIIFDHPTIDELASYLASLLSQTPEPHEEAARSGVDAAEIESLTSKYTHDMPGPRFNGQVWTASGPVVVLTGSTGNIGSHILAQLLSDDRIPRIFTLNRPSSDPDARLRAAFVDRGLPAGLLSLPKLSSWIGDITQHNFGLDQTQYSEVCR